MKHFITASFILFAITASSIFVSQYMEHVSNKMVAKLESCETSVTVGNWDDAENNINEAEEIWNKSSPKLSAFVLDSDLDEISEALNRTNTLIRTRNQTDFPVENKYLTEQVKKFGKMNNLTFENLF